MSHEVMSEKYRLRLLQVSKARQIGRIVSCTCFFSSLSQYLDEVDHPAGNNDNLTKQVPPKGSRYLIVS
jgi:hypothetical protein